MRMLNLSVAGILAALLYVGASALTSDVTRSETVFPAQDIEWVNLQPETPATPSITGQVEPKFGDSTEQWLSDADPFGETIPNSEEEALAELSRIPKQDIAPVVEAFDGKRVRLAGYMVPLDFEATKLKRFLLVPYVGACIHVPAPASNQVVFIETDEAVEFTGLYDPVHVTGTMSTTSSKTELAEAGYKIKADDIQPYE